MSDASAKMVIGSYAIQAKLLIDLHGQKESARLCEVGTVKKRQAEAISAAGSTAVAAHVCGGGGWASGAML